MELSMAPIMPRCWDHLEIIRRLDEVPNANVSTNPKGRPNSLPNVKLKLMNQDLWQKFHKETTEMIITKVGRRMFPHLQLSVTGLQKDLLYCVFVELVLASPHRHKYSGSNAFDENMNMLGGAGGWTNAGQAESQPSPEQRIYVHPDSPASGTHWMQQMVCFNKLKITNDSSKRGSNVLLTSMHKYIPKFLIVQSNNLHSLNKMYSQPHAVVVFKETEFIAVTAYQNEKITQLKIEYNPFAKGFRETGHSRSKRKCVKMDADRSDQTDEDDSNSSSESGLLPRKSIATTLSRTGAFHSNAGIGVIDEVRLPSQMIVPVQDFFTSRAESHHRAARQAPAQSSRPHTLHRPWLNTSPQRLVDLNLPPASSVPLLQPHILSDLSLYNRQATPDSLSYGFMPTHYPYYPFVYPFDLHHRFYPVPNCTPF